MNKPTCRYCKKKLTAKHVYTSKIVNTERVKGELIGYGYHATGLFCSAKCGHAWAVRALRGK